MARRIGAVCRYALFVGAVALCSCSHPAPAQHVAQPKGGPITRPAVSKASAAPPPLRTPVVAPTARPVVAPSPAAVATPVVLPPNAPPQIYSVQMQSQTIQAGQVAAGTVVTSSNVASVEARVAGYGASASRTGVGRFALSYRVPDLPFFLKGRSYTLQVIARNARGVATEKDLPITIR